MQSLNQQTSSLAGCISACATTAECVTASYVGVNCYMKRILDAPVKNANVIGVAITSGTASPPIPNNDKQTCPASFSCPENNGCSYTDGTRTLVLSCSVDFYGGDYANQYANSLKACTQACASDTRCVAASFVGGKDAGTCYLKGTKNPGNIDYKFNAVYVAATIVQSSSTTSPSSSPTASSITTRSTSIITSSSITSFSITFATISSSTPVSSTISTPSSTTPTPTCAPADNGDNLLSNPSFKQNKGAGTKATDWTPSSNFVYPVNHQPVAHSGNSYLVFLAYQKYGYMAAASQKISSPLNTSRSYKASFWLFSYQGSASNGCTAQLYANDVQIYSVPITSFSNTVNYSQHVSPAFTPKSSDVTLKLQFQCSSGSSTFIVDDVALMTACA